MKLQAYEAEVAKGGRLTRGLNTLSLEKYVVFVQSTSNNRKLMGGSRFLYEVEDWDGARA
jgi:hypothetical protein